MDAQVVEQIYKELFHSTAIGREASVVKVVFGGTPTELARAIGRAALFQAFVALSAVSREKYDSLTGETPEGFSKFITDDFDELTDRFAGMLIEHFDKRCGEWIDNQPKRYQR